MADEQVTPVTPTPAAPAAPVSAIPEDYEELRSYRQTYEPILARVAEHWDDFRPLLEDEQELELVRQARQARQDYLEKQKPKLTPELEMIREEFKNELDPIVGYVKSQQQEREAAEKSKIEAAQKANVEYAQKLVAERPDLAEDNYAGILMLSAYAQQRGYSLEEAWKAKGSSLSAPTPKREPPTSLRGGQAAPGVPGESSLPPIKSGKDLRNRLVANLKAAGMKG